MDRITATEVKASYPRLMRKLKEDEVRMANICFDMAIRSFFKKSNIRRKSDGDNSGII